MRIVFVLEYFYAGNRPVGGAERQLEKLARELIRQGQNVTILTGAWGGRDSSDTTVDNLPVWRLFSGGRALDRRGLRRIAHYIFLLNLFIYLVVHRHRYDVIHCHSAMTSAFIVGLVGTLLNVPTVARPMASGPTWGDIARMKNRRDFFGGRSMLKGLHRINLIVALTSDVVKDLEDIGVPRSKIVLIPNGVQLDPACYKSDYALGDPVTITFVGRLHPQKAIDLLLDALSRLKAIPGGPQWKLQIVGEGPLRECLEDQARQLRLQSSVAFFGQVSDVTQILHSSDLFVLPSRAEGMSNALLEAMSVGLPCIGSDISANAALLHHEANGLLFKVDDPSSLTDCILHITKDQQLRERLGREAIETISQNYSVESVAKSYSSVYERLVNH
jgi:glycosyltransferase involved in cell wall biosynthesis